ncbi:MAG: hypothetical protein PHQ27_07165 [Victivallales bacterium]|nr:hypothetical protein [Victivallales bacterium]
MKAKSKIIVWLLICFSCISYCSAKEIKIGDKTITIPLQDGFVDSASVDANILPNMTQFIPKDFEALALYVARSDAVLLATGKKAVFDKYMALTTLKETSDLFVPPHYFSKLKNGMRNQYGSSPEWVQKERHEFEKKISKMISTADAAADYKIDKIIPLGIDFENENMISVSVLSRKIITIKKRKIPFFQVSSITLLLIRGKVLCLYVYNNYKEQQDLIWVQKQSRAIAQSIVTANSGGMPGESKLTPKNSVISSLPQNLLKEKRQTYSTAGNPNAKGLDVSIEIPETWKREGSSKTDIVQNFMAWDRSGVLISSLIMVEKTPGMTREVVDGLTADAFKTADDFGGLLYDKEKFVRGGLTVIGGEKTIWFESVVSAEHANIHMTVRLLRYLILYDGKTIIINFSVSGAAGGCTDAVFQAYIPLFQKIIATTVIRPKWKKE